MTALSAQPPRRNFWRPNWLVLAIGAVLGILIGLAAYVLIFGEEAIAIVQAARVGGMESMETRVTPTLVVERHTSPQLLIEEMQTALFAEKIAAKLGEPSLVSELPARQYGGYGKLKVRAIGDGTLIEIKVRPAGAIGALPLAQAIADVVLAEDAERIKPLQDIAARRRDEAKARLDAAVALSDTYAEQVKTLGALDEQDRMLALSAAGAAQANVIEAQDLLWNLEVALAEPMSQQTKLFAPPAIVRSLISSPLIAGLLGLAGGLCAAYAFTLLGRSSQRPVTA